MKARMTLKKKILVLNIFPLLLLGLMVIILSLTVIKQSLISEVETSLRSAATAALSAYDQNAGLYMEADNGDIWKGSYNISKSESIVDGIKERSGLEVTFFYGDRRVMTSAVDIYGNRIISSPAGEKIKQVVLTEGKEYFSDAVSIDDTRFYGYYLPVYQTGGNQPIGMIFVGTDKASKDKAIGIIISNVIMIVVVLMVVFMIVSVVFSTSISGSLKKSIGVLQAVAAGDLKINIDSRLLRKKDEVGDLSRAVKQLQQELTESLEVIADNSKTVMESSATLEEVARETNASVRRVEDAVNGISESASVQARISDEASQNFARMGEKIQQTSREMEDMKSGAAEMKEAEEKTAETIDRLLKSNVEVQELIHEISAQTNQTNESARKIQEVTEIISAIADETNLLSLNAGIEAARAGEHGRGFAVVADQIQKLANQSNDSSMRIADIVRQLIEDSDKTVATMEKVIETVSAQSSNMQQTGKMTGEVMEKIENSMSSLSIIEDSVAYLDQSRNEVINTVNELSDIAKQNAATTQDVCDIVNNVSESFEQMEKSTQGLKSIADNLEESVKHFNV
ncbi:MAG: methyl-accepting chemotaxis protein [Acetatifactor sp.]